MKFVVDVDSRALSIENEVAFVRGSYVPVELSFVRRGVPFRLPLGTGIAINSKLWTARGSTTVLATTNSIARPDADGSPYTCTLNLNLSSLLALFTTAVEKLELSLECQWEDSPSSAQFIKSTPRKIVVVADTYRDGDVTPAVTPIVGLSFVTTQAEGSLSGEHVITGSSTITVTVATGLVTLSIPSDVPLAGNPTTTTQSAGNNTTRIATTEFVTTAVAALSVTYQPLDTNLTELAALGTTKGDIAVFNGTAWIRLGVGTDTHVLTADSAQTLGVKWSAAAAGSGTVTSVSWTGGIVTVANGTTAAAFTIAGTSGGIPYFSSGTTWATSAALAANALVVGGGAGVAPSTVTTGTGVLTALGIAVNTLGGTLTTIPTGKTMWVDSVNGNDANAGTLRYPFLTLAAAKAAATSGDLIHTGPGTYTETATIAKAGVSHHFESGASVSRSTSTASGLIDDDGAAMTLSVTGGAALSLTQTVSGYVAAIHTGHASSNVSVGARSVAAATSGVGQNAMAIYGQAGTLFADITESITATDSIVNSGIALYWENGPMYVRCPKITGSDQAVYSQVDSSPTGDLIVDADLIQTTYAVDANGTPGVVLDISTDSAAASWVRSAIVKSPGPAIASVLCGINENKGAKLYVTAQKLFGRVKNGGGANALLYVNADKIEGVGNGTSALPALFSSTGTGTSRITCRQWNPSTYSGEQIKVTGGTVYLNGGDFIGNASSNGIEVTGGTVYLENMVIDTSANASTNGLTVSGGTVYLINCKIAAHASGKDIAQSGGTVTVTGGSGSGTLGAFTTSGTVGYTKAPTALLADTVTTNANLTGHVTSTGNAAVLGSFTLAELSTAVSDANIARTDAAQSIAGTQTFTGSITLTTTSASLIAHKTADTTLGLSVSNDSNSNSVALTPTQLIWTTNSTNGVTNMLAPAGLVGTVNITTPSETGTLLTNLTVTGGGIVATGGFTLTIPATGTAALLGVANTFTAANSYTLGTNSATPVTAETLINSTAAISGTQSASPAFIWTGQGWKTTATAASQSVSFKTFALPVQGTTAPTGLWTLQADINGGGYSNVMTISSAGVLTMAGATQELGCVSVRSSNGNYITYNAPTFHAFQTGYLNIGSTTDTTSGATGSIFTAGGIGITKAVWIGTNLTVAGKVITTPLAHTATTAAIPVTAATVALTTTAPAQACTLADGTAGQIVVITHIATSGGGTCVLTPTTKTGYTTITFTAVTDTVTLQFYTTIGWVVIASRGSVIA
jgi:hypothetical protein